MLNFKHILTLYSTCDSYYCAHKIADIILFKVYTSFLYALGRVVYYKGVTEVIHSQSFTNGPGNGLFLIVTHTHTEDSPISLLLIILMDRGGCGPATIYTM